MKALKVTISGSFRTDGNKIVDFQDITGVMPAVEDDLVLPHCLNRYARIWLEGKKTERFDNIRQVFVDNVEETEHKFTFIGKDIKEMSMTELQDLAVVKGLRIIPLYKDTSLHEMRKIAYVEYSNKFLGTKIVDGTDAFNYAKAKAIIVDGEIDERRIMPKSADEAIKDESGPLSKEDLKQILREKGIKFGPNTGYDGLYKLAFEDVE